jgi:hypothetical protein
MNQYFNHNLPGASRSGRFRAMGPGGLPPGKLSVPPGKYCGKES